MSVKLYQLYCEICNYKRITDGSDVEDLNEIKTSSVPAGVPYIDFETNNVIVPKSKKQMRKFKCPNCGRLVMPRKIDNPQEKLAEKLEAEERKRKRHEEDRIDGSEAGSA